MKTIDEDWRKIEDWPYEVSSLGRIRNRRGRIMSLGKTYDGYIQVGLCLQGVPQKNCRVHRLACAAFHGPPPEGMTEPQVDHRNYVRDDNRAENLRWISRAENRAHRREPRDNNHCRAKLTEENVLELRRTPYYLGMYVVLGARFGVSDSTIHRARNGNAWKHIPASETNNL